MQAAHTPVCEVRNASGSGRQRLGMRASGLGGTLRDMDDAPARAAALAAYHASEVVDCVRCPLHQTRTQVVVGSGDPDADVLFVGEAPGYHEDKDGVPFVGAAGKLLDKLLAGIGMTRADVFVANVLKCRPPGNRDPLAAEIEACEGHLFRQVGIIRPKLICTLGNFATKLISGRPDGISRVHGNELPIEIGGHKVLLYPLYHPAAALYMPSMLATLEADFARIPGLIGAPVPTPIILTDTAAPSPEAAPPLAEVDHAEVRVDAAAKAAAAEPQQLGLF
jgi:uracil-DNA glycosylase